MEISSKHLWEEYAIEFEGFFTEIVERFEVTHRKNENAKSKNCRIDWKGEKQHV
jgi:hypothetical protein